MPKKQPWWSRQAELGLRRLYLHYTGREPGEAWHRWALEAHYPDQALEFLELAAQAQWPDALFELGLQEELGTWGRGGLQACTRHYLAAAQRGHGEAAFRLAELLRWGTHGAKDPKEAHRWYLHSARLGFGPAMAWLAQALETGDGSPVNTNQADAWRARLETQAIGTTLRQPAPLGKAREAGGGWLREALQDSAQALAELPGFESSARGLTWFLVFAVPLVCLAAAGFLFLNGGVFGMVAVIPAATALAGLTAMHFLQRRNMAMSRSGRRTEADAAQGDPEACHRMGLSFLHGDHDRPADTVAARQWLLRAAQSGHLGAMTEVGELLSWGVGGPKDAAGGRAWLERAAAAGHEAAHTKLGRMATPEGVPEP
jgi:hypothetical protein